MSIQQMPVHRDSPAVGVARAHAQAWNDHDWATAREGPAADSTSR